MLLSKNSLYGHIHRQLALSGKTLNVGLGRLIFVFSFFESVETYVRYGKVLSQKYLFYLFGTLEKDAARIFFVQKSIEPTHNNSATCCVFRLWRRKTQRRNNHLFSRLQNIKDVSNLYLCMFRVWGLIFFARRAHNPGLKQ